MHLSRRPAAVAASLLAVAGLGAGVAFAATGDQDPDFNGGQTRSVDFPNSYFDQVSKVAVAPDGSIFLAGCGCDGEGYKSTSLAHLSAGGDPIAAFGGTGAITDDEHAAYGAPTALGFAPNGDVLVGTSTYGQQILTRLAGSNDPSIDGDFTVLRYNASGTFVDQAREDFSGEWSGVGHSPIRGFVPTPDGGQLVLGSAGDGEGTHSFARVDLAPDDSVTAASLDNQGDGGAFADAIVAGAQPGGPAGSYVIAGFGQGSAALKWTLRRYDAAGNRDTTYGGDFLIAGEVLPSPSDGAIAGDGAIYMIDTSNNVLVRFTIEGQPDDAFGSIPGSILGEGGDLTSVAGTADGKALVAGTIGDQVVVARVNPDGTLDTTFGDGGRRTLPLLSSAYFMDPTSLAVQADGKAVVAGDAGVFNTETVGKDVGLTSSKVAIEGPSVGFVTRLTADPKAPVTTTTDPTPTTTTTATQTTTTTATTPKPVVAASGNPLPAAKSCVSRRSFKIRLRIPRDVKPTSATVKVNGKKIKVVTGSRLRAAIDLRGLPKGKATVSIVVKLAGGKPSLTGSRTYHTCVPKKSGSVPKL